jgi:hypothetical protein
VLRFSSSNDFLKVALVTATKIAWATVEHAHWSRPEVPRRACEGLNAPRKLRIGWGRENDGAFVFPNELDSGEETRHQHLFEHRNDARVVVVPDDGEVMDTSNAVGCCSTSRESIARKAE